MHSTKRVGYHDFKAFTQQLANGRYQGVAFVMHHTFAGTKEQKIQAGQPTDSEWEAFAIAQEKVAELVKIAYPRLC